MGDDFFAAVEQAVFPFLGDGQGVGYQVAFAGLQLADEVTDVPGHFHLELQAEALGELFAQFVLESHVLSAVDEVGRGAVEGEHHQFAAVLDLLQVVHAFFLTARTIATTASDGQQTQQDRSDDACQPTISHLSLFMVSHCHECVV